MTEMKGNDLVLTPAQRLARAKPVQRFVLKPSSSNRYRAVLECRLFALRRGLGLTLDDVSKAVRISKAHLHQVEHGAEIGLTLAFRLASFYGKRIETLWKTPAKEKP